MPPFHICATRSARGRSLRPVAEPIFEIHLRALLSTILTRINTHLERVKCLTIHGSTSALVET